MFKEANPWPGLLGKASVLVSTFCIVVWRSRCHQLGEVDGLARGYPTALGWPEALLSLQTKGYLHRNLWRKSECPVSQLSLALPSFRRDQRCHSVYFAPSFQAHPRYKAPCWSFGGNPLTWAESIATPVP